MQVNFTFRNLESTEALKDYAKKKVAHVEKYLDHATSADVVLSLERYLHHADIFIRSGIFDIRGKEKSEDMYASIDLAVDKIERQLKRYKDKLRGRKPAMPPVEVPPPVRVRYDVLSASALEEPRSSSGPRIVKSNEIVAKPMSVDEAVMQMDLLGNDFLVFTNAQSNHVNVVYRRKDGNYGLIETRH